MRIVADPGHGGRDSGAVGPSGVQEKVVVLPVAKKLADILAAAGAQVRMTRTDDSEPSLAQRAAISNSFSADLFISIHANAYSSPTAKGVEVWTCKGQTAADPLAECIANSLQVTFPGLVFRADMSDGDQDKEANYYVLRYTNAPAVLVELAFITNPVEEELLNSADYQEKAAWAIAEGIAKYTGLTLPAPVQTVDATTEAINKLQAAGAIKSPEYWLEVARPGKQADGQYVGMLIQNMARVI